MNRSEGVLSVSAGCYASRGGFVQSAVAISITAIPFLSSCARQTPEPVCTYLTGYGSAVSLGSTGTPSVAVWRDYGWDWIRNGAPIDTGVFARWTNQGGIDLDFSGRYRSGVRIEPWAEMPEVSRVLVSPPPLRWSGFVDSQGRACGDWTALDCDGRVVWLVQYEAGMRDGQVIGWHSNGSVKLRGEFHLLEPAGDWSVWSEDGRLLKTLEVAGMWDDDPERDESDSIEETLESVPIVPIPRVPVGPSRR